MAGVNEVTLFRHFGSKELLLTAVIARFQEARLQVLDEAVTEYAPLEETLTRYAAAFRDSMKPAAGFLRTMMAECERHPQRLRETLYATVKPTRDRLLAILLEARRRGEIGAGIDCEVALDLFSGMLFWETIRPELIPLPYSSEAYLREGVALFLRGVRP